MTEDTERALEEMEKRLDDQLRRARVDKVIHLNNQSDAIALARDQGRETAYLDAMRLVSLVREQYRESPRGDDWAQIEMVTPRELVQNTQALNDVVSLAGKLYNEMLAAGLTFEQRRRVIDGMLAAAAQGKKLDVLLTLPQAEIDRSARYPDVEVRDDR